MTMRDKMLTAVQRQPRTTEVSVATFVAEAFAEQFRMAAVGAYGRLNRAR
jgi:hypothetical protein